jgi:hypothetical protein
MLHYLAIGVSLHELISLLEVRETEKMIKINISVLENRGRVNQNRGVAREFSFNNRLIKPNWKKS